MHFFFVKGLFLFPENLSLVLGILKQCWLLPALETWAVPLRCVSLVLNLTDVTNLNRRRTWHPWFLSLWTGWSCLALALVPLLLSSKQQVDPTSFRLLDFFIFFFLGKKGILRAVRVCNLGKGAQIWPFFLNSDQHLQLTSASLLSATSE